MALAALSARSKAHSLKSLWMALGHASFLS